MSLIQADAARIPYADKTFHCIVTSPPYFGLRKYQGEQGRVWGGDPDCAHEWVDTSFVRNNDQTAGPKQRTNIGAIGRDVPVLNSTCQLCGAWMGALGLEPTPEQHIENIVEVFREVRRVLRDDGCAWLNYGDCFQGENIRSDNIASLSEVDASWLAALIDSDGSITITRNKRSNKKTISYHALVAVTQTKKQMVNRAHDLCGGATSSEKRPERERTFFRWYLAGQQAAPILHAIYPYLMLKQAQAALAIMLCEHVTEKKFHRSNPITQEAMEYREALKESIRRLNALKPTIIEPKRPRLYKHGMAQGNLLLMPHRVAIALQEDGWIIRNDVVWWKRNPMPESVAGCRWERHRIKQGRSKHAAEHNIKGGYEKMLEDASVHQGINEDWVPDYIDCPGCEKCLHDNPTFPRLHILKEGSWRHTRAHEYVFQLVKGPKMNYWSNQEAVRERSVSGEQDLAGSFDEQGSIVQEGNNRTGKSTRRFHESGGRNPRSVLDVPTAPYKGAHYATFPPNLIAPLIRATCPRRSCPECGTGWAPVVEREFQPQEDVSAKKGLRGHDGQKQMDASSDWQDFPRGETKTNVLAQRPTCKCRHEDYVPGIVLDPFGGSGTTGMVAKELQRRWVVMDISMPYLDEQAKVRTRSGSPSNALDGLPMFEGLKDPKS